MKDIDIIRSQRDILFEAAKKVATNHKCPAWIAKILSEAVMQSKKLQNSADIEVTSDTTLSKTIEVGATVKSNKKNDTCIYKIMEEGPVIQGVKLYTLVIIKGNKDNPEGHVLYNVPENWLVTSN